MLQAFSNKYPVAKTLRFELKPVGKTLAHINKKGFIEEDESLAQNYKNMKKTIDVYHKDFISRALSTIVLKGLPDFFSIYNQNKASSDDATKKQVIKAQDDMRKQITSVFTSNEFKDEFDSLFKKELLTKNLKEFVTKYNTKNKAELFFVDDFKSFTGYFLGFHENRKNIYSSDPKHSALAFRLVHENLPRFIENTNGLQAIKDDHPKLFDMLAKQVNHSLDFIFSSGFSIEDMLDVEFYDNILTQQGIDKYNQILGGVTLEGNPKKLQGLNELINLYNQKLPKISGVRKAPKLRPMYKQILSDRGSLSFLPEKFADDGELYDAVNEYYLGHLLATPDNTVVTTLLEALKEMTTRLSSYDLTKIYLKNDKALAHISNTLFSDYSVLSTALSHYYEAYINPLYSELLDGAKTQKKAESLTKEKDSFLKGFHSISTIERAYREYVVSIDDDSDLRTFGISRPVQHYFSQCFVNKPSNEDKSPIDCLQDISNKYTTIKGKLNSEVEAGTRELIQKGAEVANIKHFLDAIMGFIHFIKPLSVAGAEIEGGLDIDPSFYNEFLPLYEELGLFFPLYNKVRDYISQKPFSQEKFKLNFENTNLLTGWDANKEKERLSIIFRQNGHYYLGIIDKAHKKSFESLPQATEHPDKCYQKMHYKLLPGPNKMLPKVFFAASNIDYYNPSEVLLSNYKKGTHKKGVDFNIKHCHELIDFFKQSIAKHEDWRQFGFKFSDTSTYQDLSGFYNEISNQGYKVGFVDVDSSYIDDLVDSGCLYLFEIYNKDFSAHSKGRPNLHTIYFKSLFSDENLADTVYKLNGDGEMFYRRSSIKPENTITHKKGERVHSKNPNTPDASRVLDYEIVKDRRYTEDKFQLHLSVTMNFKASGIGPGQFNNLVKATIRDNKDKDMHIIGIDRGERHLLYLTVIDKNGKLVHQESLNNIVSGDTSITPYHKLLDNREKERADARKNWGAIEGIKDLKKGYLSQVVHKLATLIYEYNAVVALEDLNFGFKRGRFKVEKQVYQNFEKALIDKLNYLVFKDREPDDIGGARKALQLTSPFSSFKDLGKQTGFLFYVPAWNTSKIDPVTGFVDLLKPKYENLDKAKDFIDRFEAIRYNKDKDYFEFVLDYDNFNNKATGTRTDWTVCSHGSKRFVYDRKVNNNRGGQKTVDVNAELKALFDGYDIDYEKLAGSDLRSFIKNKADKLLYSTLMHLLRVLLAMRYSKANTSGGADEDFILSPVPDENGVFFDTRDYLPANKGKKGGTHGDLPQDSDANGAYHIALKGLWVVRQIQNHKGEDFKGLDLKITNKDWLNFAQTKPY